MKGSGLTMTLDREGVKGGVLILCQTDRGPFDEEDIDKLERLREHAVSAVAKSNMLKQLREHNDEILSSREAMALQEKMASLGLVTAGVAHEISNPGNFTRGGVYNLEKALTRFRKFLFDLAGDDVEPEVLAELDNRFRELERFSLTIKEGTDRILELVHDLQSVSRGGHDETFTADINQGLRSTINLVKPNYYHDVVFQVELEGVLLMDCNPAKLNQVFMNLLVNACQAVRRRQESEGDRRKHEVRVRSFHEGEEIVLTFEDQGCGMPTEVMEKIFEPFFTTGRGNEGTGLGLSISHEIVRRHRGKIEVNSAPGEGTRFTLRFPAAPELEDEEEESPIQASYFSVGSWEAFRESTRAAGLDFCSMEELLGGTAPGEILWFPLEEWEQLEDGRILEEMTATHTLEGHLTAVTDLSYLNHLGPFSITADDFAAFLEEYRDQFQERFFNGDVILFEAEKRWLWLFHHEGRYATLPVSPA